MSLNNLTYDAIIAIASKLTYRDLRSFTFITSDMFHLSQTTEFWHHVSLEKYGRAMKLEEYEYNLIVEDETHNNTFIMPTVSTDPVEYIRHQALVYPYKKREYYVTYTPRDIFMNIDGETYPIIKADSPFRAILKLHNWMVIHHNLSLIHLMTLDIVKDVNSHNEDDETWSDSLMDEIIKDVLYGNITSQYIMNDTCFSRYDETEIDENDQSILII